MGVLSHAQPFLCKEAELRLWFFSGLIEDQLSFIPCSTGVRMLGMLKGIIPVSNSLGNASPAVSLNLVHMCKRSISLHSLYQSVEKINYFGNRQKTNELKL